MRYRTIWAIAALLVCGIVPRTARAQTPNDCHWLCSPELLFEPTFTVENLANRPRILDGSGRVTRPSRSTVFEIVVAVDIPTRWRRIGLTSEAIWSPASAANEVQLEFELNLTFLEAAHTHGWVSSHFDVVDQFGPAERPNASTAFSHKLDLEIDTAIAIFKNARVGSWLKTIEIEGSLDYLATGLPRRGDRLDEGEYLDPASRWSFSLVLVVPVAPR
jgi:hypothetical protein